MYKIFFVVFFSLITVFSIGQERCGTKDKEIDVWLAEMEAFGGRPEVGKYLASRGTVYIPMHYHIVTKSDKTGAFPYFLLYNLHCDLNKNYKYNGLDFVFYLDTISFINSTSLFTITNTTERQLTNYFNTLKNCNVYLLDDPNGACGYTYRPQIYNSPANRSAIFLKGSLYNYDCTDFGSITLTHEMGHWLDLPHTFYGWEGKEYNTSTALSSSKRENVARTGTNANCTKTGDLFCDTDPDYSSDRWPCHNSATFTDPTGATFKPDPSMIMSYCEDSCMYRFSESQKTQISYSMTKYNERKDILTFSIPTDIAMDSFHLFSPKTTPSTRKMAQKGLKLYFNYQKGASKYLVTLAKGTTSFNSNFIFTPTNILMDTLITDTSILVNQSLFGTSSTNNYYYYWKVRAINKLYPCNASENPTQAFRINNTDITVNITNNTCSGQLNGRIDIINNSGLTNLRYSLDGVSFSDNFVANLPAGFYNLEVKFIDNTTMIIPCEISNTVHVTGKNHLSYWNVKCHDFGKQWYLPIYVPLSNGSTSNTLTASAGTYTVVITDNNGCQSDEISVVLTNAAIANLNNTNSSIFPTLLRQNEPLHIKLDKNYALIQISIYNSTGQIVEKSTFKTPNSNTEISKGIAVSGTYIISCDLDDKHIVQKVLVQ